MIYLEDMEHIANQLGLELITTSFDDGVFRTTLIKPTGGKIIATCSGDVVSVYGVAFNATALSDSFYWALQYAAHCR